MNNAKTALIIKELCKKNKISVSKLLSETSIRKNLIYDMEKRDWTPPVSILEKIADYLNCSVDYLLGRTDNPNSHREIAKISFDLPQFTVRIDPLSLKKFRYVAEYNARSVNYETEILIRRRIEQFEKRHGEINFDEN